MKIAVVISAYHVGTTGDYVATALKRKGHQADILSQQQMIDSLKRDQHDLYFCVDSGGPIDLLNAEVDVMKLKRFCFWLIDYRHNKVRPERRPNDRTVVDLVTSMGGWVFQSQYEDLVDCIKDGFSRCSWLPLAADQEVWNSEPKSNKDFDVGFVGNVWDGTRDAVLKQIGKRFKLGFLGAGAAWLQAGADVLRRSKVGFNISSFYGSAYAYDVNMRVFETLACGVPLVTNDIPSISKLFAGLEFVKTYKSTPEIIMTIDKCLGDDQFMKSGDAARDWVVENCTYDVRMEQAFAVLEAQGVLK